MSKVHWLGLMRLGMEHLRLPAAQFWELTPAELFFLAGMGGDGSLGMTRAALDKLEAAYPDAPKGKKVEDGGP